MNLDDFVTNNLKNELVAAITCTVLNSEGKRQPHDWGDPYKKWGWHRWYPVRRGGYMDCVRCGYTSRRLR